MQGSISKPYIIAIRQYKSTLGTGSPYAGEPEFRIDETIMSESEFNEFYIAQKAKGIDVVII